VDSRKRNGAQVKKFKYGGRDVVAGRALSLSRVRDEFDTVSIFSGWEAARGDREKSVTGRARLILIFSQPVRQKGNAHTERLTTGGP